MEFIMPFLLDENLALGQSVVDEIVKSGRWDKEVRNLECLIEGFKRFAKTDLCVNGNQVFGEYTQTLINKYLNDLKDLVNSSKKYEDKVKRNLIRCIIDKLRMIFESLPSCYELSIDDLECLPENHPRQVSLASITTVYKANLPLYTSQLQKFLIKYNTLKVSFLQISKYAPSTFRNLLTGVLIVYYLTHTKKRENLLALYNIKCGIESIKLLWHFTESDLAKKALPRTFCSISTNFLIYIPRLCPVITDNSPLPENTFLTYTLDPDPNKIQVRVLCKHKTNLKSSKTLYNRLIIHVHGGGFIGQTSFSHQSYLRIWANAIDYPIFSIDYRLAPYHKFPAGIDDVWQAYTWLVNNAEKALGIVPEKIVLVGDSAGGNFITGITLKAKEVGFRQPDCLLMIYPSMNMQAKYISSGAFFSLEDPLLTYGSFFEICKHYTDNPEDLNSYLISPVLCPDHLLLNFPRTILMLTCQDPLRSDSLRFIERVFMHKNDVHILKYPDYVHGALNLATPNGVPILEHFIYDALDQLKSLIS